MTAHQDATPDEALARGWDAEPDDRQPWCPPGAWVPDVGDRVAFCYRAECERHEADNFPGALLPCDGAGGIVVRVDSGAHALMGHPYKVHFDQGIRSVRPNGRPGIAYGIWASAAELRPLDQSAADDEGAR